MPTPGLKRCYKHTTYIPACKTAPTWQKWPGKRVFRRKPGKIQRKKAQVLENFTAEVVCITGPIQLGPIWYFLFANNSSFET